jgi:hypothetical protein
VSSTGERRPEGSILAETSTGDNAAERPPVAASRGHLLADPPGKGLPAHPPEPTYPCCLPALGEFSGMTPHGEPDTTVPVPGEVLTAGRPG